MTKLTPLETLSRGYQASTEVGAKRRRKIAASFRVDPRSERILELKQRDPAAYARLDSATRTSVAMYEQAKQVAAEVNGGNHDEAA